MARMNEVSMNYHQTQNEERAMSGDHHDEHSALSTTNDVPADDGFADAASDAQGRVIRGQLLKFADGRWTVGKEGTPAEDGMQLIVLSMAQAWTRLKRGEPPQYLWRQPRKKLCERETLPDLDERDWEPGLDGKPQDPWRNTTYVWLATRNGELFTFANASWRARTGAVELADTIQNMRFAQPNARAVVVLSSMPRKDRYGVKPGPVFKIIDWVLSNSGGEPRLASKETAEPMKQIESPKIIAVPQPPQQQEEPPPPSSPDDYCFHDDALPF
jgi:hypothetical protein